MPGAMDTILSAWGLREEKLKIRISYGAVDPLRRVKFQPPGLYLVVKGLKFRTEDWGIHTSHLIGLSVIKSKYISYKIVSYCCLQTLFKKL